ncbi:hypothetical protein PTKU46_52150 [Paraburkholderia terrae]
MGRETRRSMRARIAAHISHPASTLDVFGSAEHTSRTAFRTIQRYPRMQRPLFVTRRERRLLIDTAHRPAVRFVYT